MFERQALLSLTGDDSTPDTLLEAGSNEETLLMALLLHNYGTLEAAVQLLFTKQVTLNDGGVTDLWAQSSGTDLNDGGSSDLWTQSTKEHTLNDGGTTDLWTQSGSGTAEYYYTGSLLGGIPAVMNEDGSPMTGEGTLGSLSAGEWAWGDNDSLGYSVPYIRMASDTDPDGAAVNTVTATTHEYYYTGSDVPAEPATVNEDGSALTKGALGSLADGEWAFGDQDSIGSDKLYIRMSDHGDPDGASAAVINIGLDEYYYAGSAITQKPTDVEVAASVLTARDGTVSVLPAGGWGWGDNDGLGVSTLYMRLADDSDPDAAEADTIQADDTDFKVNLTFLPDGFDSSVVPASNRIALNSGDKLKLVADQTDISALVSLHRT